MPVKVVLRHIEHDGGSHVQAAGCFKLKTGQLKHPDIGQGLGIERLEQASKGGGANIARCMHRDTRRT